MIKQSKYHLFKATEGIHILQMAMKCHRILNCVPHITEKYLLFLV